MPKSKASKHESIEKSYQVGRIEESGGIFISCTPEYHERIKAPLTGRTLHAVSLSENTARWLIGALRKELYGQPDDDVEQFMDKEVHETGGVMDVFQCDYCKRFIGKDHHVIQPPTESWKTEPEDPIYLCPKCFEQQEASDAAE